DETAQAPYIKNRGGLGIGTYDNPKSLGLKCRYVLDHGLSGVLIWVLGSDLVGNRTPLLDALARSFGGKTRPVPPSALAQVDLALRVSAKSAWNDLSEMSKRLLKEGKIEESASIKPEALPGLRSPAAEDPKAL